MSDALAPTNHPGGRQPQARLAWCQGVLLINESSFRCAVAQTGAAMAVHHSNGTTFSERGWYGKDYFGN